MQKTLDRLSYVDILSYPEAQLKVNLAFWLRQEIARRVGEAVDGHGEHFQLLCRECREPHGLAGAVQRAVKRARVIRPHREEK